MDALLTQQGSRLFPTSWSRDGRFLLYHMEDAPRAPQRLPFPPTLDVTSRPQSSADGQGFLVEVTQDRREARPSISVVLNWPALLKK